MMRPATEWEAPFSRSTCAEIPIAGGAEAGPDEEIQHQGRALGQQEPSPREAAAMGNTTPMMATRSEAMPTFSICGTVDSRPTANMRTTTPRPPNSSVAGDAATSGNAIQTGAGS